MNGLKDYYEDNKTSCFNISEIVINEYQNVMIFSVISILLLLVPTLILQLLFVYRYKSTFLHRQFLYATIVVILLGIIYILYPSSFNIGCPLFYIIVNSSNRYLFFVEMLQITTIHLLLLYKFCKHMETRIMQRIQTLCCNIRPSLWHEVMIVCIQLGLPLPLIIDEFVVRQSMYFKRMEQNYILIPVLIANILLDLVCIVLLLVWVYRLWKRKLLKSKAKFVCTLIIHMHTVNLSRLFNWEHNFFVFKF